MREPNKWTCYFFLVEFANNASYHYGALETIVSHSHNQEKERSLSISQLPMNDLSLSVPLDLSHIGPHPHYLDVCPPTSKLWIPSKV